MTTPPAPHVAKPEGHHLVHAIEVVHGVTGEPIEPLRVSIKGESGLVKLTCKRNFVLLTIDASALDEAPETIDLSVMATSPETRAHLADKGIRSISIPTGPEEREGKTRHHRHAWAPAPTRACVELLDEFCRPVPGRSIVAKGSEGGEIPFEEAQGSPGLYRSETTVWTSQFAPARFWVGHTEDDRRPVAKRYVDYQAAETWIRIVLVDEDSPTS